MSYIIIESKSLPWWFRDFMDASKIYFCCCCCSVFCVKDSLTRGSLFLECGTGKLMAVSESGRALQPEGASRWLWWMVSLAFLIVRISSWALVSGGRHHPASCRVHEPGGQQCEGWRSSQGSVGTFPLNPPFLAWEPCPPCSANTQPLPHALYRASSRPGRAGGQGVPASWADFRSTHLSWATASPLLQRQREPFWKTPTDMFTCRWSCHVKSPFSFQTVAAGSSSSLSAVNWYTFLVSPYCPLVGFQEETCVQYALFYFRLTAL